MHSNMQFQAAFWHGRRVFHLYEALPASIVPVWLLRLTDIPKFDKFKVAEFIPEIDLVSVKLVQI